MEILHAIIEWVGTILKMTAIYIFILMGPGIIFAVILHYIHKLVESNAWAIFGRNVYLGLFGGIGTMIHELGHAIMCIPFGHQITEIELFNPDPYTGTLGYVNHSYNPDSNWALIGNFFIGIGPILIGSLVVYFAAYYLVSETFFIPFENLHITYDNFTSLASFKTLLLDVRNSFGQLFDVFFVKANLLSWKFWLFIYILFTVGSSMSLSPPDIEGAMVGFGAIIGIFILISIGTYFLEGDIDTTWIVSLTKNYSVVYALMLLSIIFNALMVFPLIILRKVLKR